MDLVSITRFESISKDLYQLENKLKQSGIQSLEVKFTVPGSAEESSVTLFNHKAPVSPITQQFATQNYAAPLYPHPPQSVPDDLSVYHPINPPPHTNLKIWSKRSAVWKIIGQIYRGFSIGFLGKLAFNFLPLLIKQGPMALFTQMSLKRCLNPAWWGLFTGSFLGIFHSIMTITKRSQDLTKHQRSFISAFAAAWSLLFLPSSERTGVAVFAFVRALETIVRAGHDAGILPYIPHADSILFGISTAQIVFAWIFARWVQDSGYNRFLDTHCGNRAQGTQQSLAYLHMIPPNELKGSPVDEPPSPVQIGSAPSGHRSPLANSSSSGLTQVIIPGSYLEGLTMGYPKHKRWESGLNIQQTIDFYAGRRATQQPATTKDGSSPASLLPSTLTTAVSPITTATSSLLSPSNTQQPSARSLLPEELVQVCNHWHKHRGQAPLYPENLTDRSKLMCQLLHPECPTSCIGGQIKAYPGVLKQGIRTYLPVYLIPGLLFRYNTMLSDPKAWLEHIAVSTLQSGLFFSNMTFMAYVFICYTRRFLNAVGSPYEHHYYLMPGLTGLAAFLAILLEQKSKRIELALFSFGHALKGLTNLLLVSEKIPLIPWANTALFAGSIAVMISAAMTNPVLLRSSYFSLLRLFLGKETPGLSSPAHLVTTTQLIDPNASDEGELGNDLKVGSPNKQQTLTVSAVNNTTITTSSSSSSSTSSSPNQQQTQWIKDVVLQDLATSARSPIVPPPIPSTTSASSAPMKHIKSFTLLSPSLSEARNGAATLALTVPAATTKDLSLGVPVPELGVVPTLNDYSLPNPTTTNSNNHTGLETDLGHFHRLQRRTSFDDEAQPMMSPLAPQ